MKHHPREILSSVAAEAGERIVDMLGADVVKSIFVSGSLPKGEIGWFERGDRLEIYSDVDISVVVADDAAWEEARIQARRAVDKIARTGERFELMRNMDVGVYLLRDLLAQPARPGTVDIAQHHQLLYGDVDIPKMMQSISSSPIDQAEALYLLENRLIEKADLFDRLREDSSEGLGRYALYAAHKTCTDAGMAALIVAKRYGGDAANKRQALNELVGKRVEGNLISTEELEKIRCSEHALADLQHTMENEKRSYIDVWNDIEPFILSLWQRLCARTLKLERATELNPLVSKRCRSGDTPGNTRSFARLARRRGFGKARSLVLGIINSRFSPMDALRLSGLVQCAVENPQAGGEKHRLNKDIVPYLDRITRIFGRGEGNVFARARKLYREVN
jgi:hypothetical protein